MLKICFLDSENCFLDSGNWLLEFGISKTGLGQVWDRSWRALGGVWDPGGALGPGGGLGDLGNHFLL